MAEQNPVSLIVQPFLLIKKLILLLISSNKLGLIIYYK